MKSHHDGHGWIKYTIINVIQPFVHVDDVNIVALCPFQGPRKVRLHNILSHRGVLAAIVAEASTNGDILLSAHPGIGRTGDDRPLT